MSIPSLLSSSVFSYGDVASTFYIRGVSSTCKPFLPTQDPFASSDNTDHHVHRFSFFDTYDSENSGDLWNPQMQIFCNYSPPADAQSWNRLGDSVTTDKRNHKMIETQRRKEIKVLFSQLRSVLPEENLRKIADPLARL